MPAGQFTTVAGAQNVAFGSLLNRPAPHSAHAVDASLLANRPGVHSAHAELPAPRPLATPSEYLPASHVSHWDEPGWLYSTA